MAAHLGIEEIPLSLSYTHNEAVACALALTEDSRTKAKARVTTPAQDLSRQFKEARSFWTICRLPTGKKELRPMDSNTDYASLVLFPLPMPISIPEVKR